MHKNADIPSSFINSIEEPILILSPESVILDLNLSAEKIFKIKKNTIIGKSISVLCLNLPLNTKNPTFGKLVSHIEEKTIMWHSFCSKTSENGAKYIFIGSIKDHSHTFSPSENIAKKIDKSTHEYIKNLNQILTGKATNLDKNTLEYVKDIYLYMENIIAEIPVSVYWMDRDCVYLGCSNSMAKLLKLESRRDIIGKTYADLYDGKSTKHYKKADRAVMDTGVSLSLEEPLYSSDGTMKIYLSKKAPLRDPNGEIIGMLGISVDITDRKKMEGDLNFAKEAAEAASRAKTEFIASMSHDIRTPLTGVIGMAEILETTLESPESQEEAHIIHDSGEELLSMLNDILDDISAGIINEENLHPETFDLYQCIEDLVKLERPTITTKHLGLYIEIGNTVPRRIINDRKKIHRILLNLLGNAIKFTKIGHITIQVTCLKRNGDDVQLQFGVTDTGIGIPKAMQSKVFDRFFRATPSYKGIYKGHGLGLHIARSYVQLLGGDITLTSKEGIGSTFHFDIPCKIAEDNDETPKVDRKYIAEIASPIPSSRPPFFLLVEDNSMALKVLASIVSKAGCRYESVMNGEEALESMKSTVFDLVITDIGLPGISGTKLTSLIRAWEKENNRAPQPIIGLTGHAREAAYDKCIAAGMNDVFTKPANLTLIQCLIKTFASNDTPPKTEENKLPTSVLGGLGKDLPNMGAELFQLEKYPLFDPKIALEQVNDLPLFFQILKDFLSGQVREDILLMKNAYAEKNWGQVESLTHKLKGGAVYLGTRRMQYACQYLEKYYKANHRSLLEQLYLQLLEVDKETCRELRTWLQRCNIKI